MYKKLLRILSAVMALVLFATGVNFPLVSFAHAEGSSGSSNVPATPDELLSMGEWQYWVEDGVAIVAGYTNPDEASLTIPYQLGGYPVAGIGHRAFSANSGLRSITVHTNVTSIADDAFAGLTGVTIAAYHGAYALSYAKTTNIKSNNLSTSAVFAEGAIDLSGLNPKSYSQLTETSVVFRKREATFLSAGQIVYFPKQGVYRTGLARRIDSIEVIDDTIIAALSEPEWGEVVQRLSGSEPLIVDWNNMILGEGVELVDCSSSSLFSAEGQFNLLSIPIGNTNVDLSLKVDVNKPTIDYDIGWQPWGLTGLIKIPNVKYVNAVIPITWKPSITVGNKDKSRNIEIDPKHITSVKSYTKVINLGALPAISLSGIITGYIGIDLLCEVSGSLEVTWNINTTFTYTLKNGKTDKRLEKNVTTETIKLQGGLKFGPELKFYFDIGWGGFTIKFFEIKAGVYVQIKVSPSVETCTGAIDILVHGTITISLEATVKGKIGLLSLGDWDINLGLELKGSLGPWKIKDWHIDFGKEFPLYCKVSDSSKDCILKKRTIVYKYEKYGSEYKKDTCNVNERITQPKDPARTGYKFDAWYVDATASGLNRGDYPFDFKNRVMPYIADGKPFVLYAKWIDTRPVLAIEINKTSITGFSYSGTRERLYPTLILPTNANNKAIYWESDNPNVATVDSNGWVSLMGAGTATITCTSVSNPIVKATCAITVKQSPTGITLNTNNIFRYSDNMTGEQLTATVLPSSVIDKSVTWESSNTAVATVSNTGYVTLKGLGTATITCRSVTHPNVTATCTVAVRQAVTSVTLNKESELRTNADMSPIKLVATVAPSNAWNKSLTWTSSDTNVATVSADGTVTPKGLGTTVITCASVSNPDKTDTFTLEIIQAVTDITLNEVSVTRYSDETTPIQLIPTIEPENAGNKAVTWHSSDPTVVTVDANGLVTIVGTGNKKEAHAIVTCQSVSNPEVTAKCSFTVLQAVTSIELNQTTINTSKDEVNPAYLQATVYPSYAYNKAVTWTSSNPDVATVTNDGVVVYKGVGQATITCTSKSTPSISATCTVNVTEAVTGITLSEYSIVRYSNQTDGVQVLAWLEAAPVSDREVGWTTDNSSVATVSPSGIITIQGVGVAMITCTSKSNPDVSADCRVEVRQSVTSITLNESQITRMSDDLGTVQLSASVLPASAANKDLIWESDNLAVATVDDTGLISLLGPGNAVITCKSISDPEIYDTCEVNIRQAVESIRLNMTSVSRYTTDNETVQLAAYLYPSYAPDRDVTWVSSDTDVITVSDGGVVTIVGAGNAIVTCTSDSQNELSAECSFTILQGVTGITLNKSTLSVYNDQTSITKLVATITPDSAANKDLVWASSNPSIVSVSDDGQLSIVGTGKATITARSVCNPTASASCTVTVKQAVQSIVLNETELVCYSDDTTEYQLTANVQPAFADNKAVTWKSSDTDVVSVGTDGKLTINGVGTAVITCTSSSKTSVKAQCTVIVKQPMTGITLDQTAIEMFSDDDEGIQLTASIVPADTDDTDIIWQSDNEYVAIVSDDGLVQAVGKGIAHITCSSARRPETTYATCTVTVKQHVEGLDIEGNTASLLLGETVQLQVNCYPEISDNTNVVWNSDNPSVASVDDSGLVTAQNYGTAVITATTTDGSALSASYTVEVEHELVLVTDVEHDTLYAQGNQNVVIANVHLGNASARRMTEAGYELTWTLSRPDQNDDVEMDILPTIAIDRDEEYDTTYALISGTWFDAVGSRTYTVTCSAGPYSASTDIVINIDNTAIAEGATHTPSTITAGINEPIVITNALSSTDSNPVPAGVQIEGISGDSYFSNCGTYSITDDGCEVSFDESGVYTATIHYAYRNVAYDVPVTFYIQDENGIVHIRVDELSLSESYLVLVQEDTRTLDYAVSPIDAYDTSVTWSSSDESVVIVNQNGLITAIQPGKASISCTSNDGSGATAICAVTVENFLQLDDSNLDFNVYTGGDDHAQLGIVNVTIDSERRLVEAGLNVMWSFEKLSGTACDIAVEEFRAEAEEGITVSGNRIRLLRINGTGTDTYRLTCRAGEYTDSCLIQIHVIESNLPAAISLNQTDYSGKVGEFITIDTGITPDTLPEGTLVRIRGGNAFENALSVEYDFTEPERLIFDMPGTFTANVVFSGDNYTYTCPIAIVVSDEAGNVPVNITDVAITPEYVSLLVGEQASLTCAVAPENATFGKTTWTSSDTGVATVSASGTVTAISAGVAFISASVPESDFMGGCMVVVEDGLTLQQSGIERTVYVDGITRTQLDIAQLTSASSQRLNKAPTWSLNRVSGNNLTLKVKEYNTVDSNGHLIYGCSIILYSLSREGDTEYELVCTLDNETRSIPITVHAVNRNNDLPAGLRFAQNVFTASVNDLIRVTPVVECLPEGTKMPDGMRVTLEGGGRFTDAVNTDDFCVSQNMTTLSFSRAGVFEANYIYSYSNMKYVVPVTFRIMDTDGSIPVLAASVSLNSRSLWLTEGETAKLSAVFTPADTDNKTVTWTSTNPSVAMVDSNGTVTAVGNGQAEIVCIPADTYLSSMVCTVYVEDYLAIETGESQASLYKQGNQTNEVFTANLTEGTIKRLNIAGTDPAWELTRVSGDHSEVISTVSADGDAVTITSAALLSGGADQYRLTCTAGDYAKAFDFSLNVVDLANTAETISAAQTQVHLAVGETAVIDFTPVSSPAGTQMPQDDHMWSLYAGVGQDFHDAMDYSVYAENGDHVTVRFTKAGHYLLSRQFFLSNLHYEQTCEIVVGEQTESGLNLLKPSTTDALVYMGGTAGTVASITFSDSIMTDVFAERIEWSLDHVSGDSTDAVVKETGNGAELVTVATYHTGEDVWRVTCTYGEYSESVDIRISVREARSEIPETVTLSINHLDGMMGNWLSMPIAVACMPSGSALPETGDDFWSFHPIGMAADVCEWEIEDGVLRARFLWPGYYTGTLQYEAGNFKYAMPVYSAITDEEGILNAPALELHLLNMPGTVYTNGQTNVVIGSVELSHGIGSYYAGEASAYMESHEGSWNISVVSGSAATLAIEENGNNSASIVLAAANGTGAVIYSVTCTVDGSTYTKEGSFMVLDGTAQPDPTLKHSVYHAVTGDTITIPTIVYERSSGAILQSTTKWVPDSVLPAIGYEYTERNDCLQMVFYREGTFTTSLTVVIGNLSYSIPFTIVVSNTPVTYRNVMKLPAALMTIDDYAFEGVNAEVVDLRGTRITSIGAGAFSHCTDLAVVYIPATVTSIASDAFYGCLNVTIVCEKNSKADTFAQQHNIPVEYE
ncbi:MAG: Ig-like domain-containing protein [Clostridia bacterium]|nr:Ig-like domain-containing protein [Clostridia bacterium]